MNVPDRDRLSMFEINHVAALAKDLVDYSSQIDLPHTMTAIARNTSDQVRPARRSTESEVAAASFANQPPTSSAMPGKAGMV